MKEIGIHTEYVTLGQMLKIADIIDTGGMAKAFLAEPHRVWINGEPDQRRGRKLYPGDLVRVASMGEYRIVHGD
jgi:ribosome-associated protein